MKFTDLLNAYIESKEEIKQIEKDEMYFNAPLFNAIVRLEKAADKLNQFVESLNPKPES